MNTYAVIDVMLSIPPIYTLPDGFDAIPRGICRYAGSNLGHDEVRFASGWGFKDKNENPMWKGRMVLERENYVSEDDLARIKHYLVRTMQKHGYVVCDCCVTTKDICAKSVDDVPGLVAVG